MQQTHAGSTLLRLLIVATVIASSCEVLAQDYPSRPIRYIVPAAAGGGPDVGVRLIAAEVVRQLGQQFVVDNRPGASGTIGVELVARSAPDGYTIGHGNILTLAINRVLRPNLPYDSEKDLQKIVQTAFVPNLLAATLSVPAKSVKELIEYARNRPGNLLYAYVGPGSSNHLSGELLKQMTNTHLVGIPYKTAQQGFTELMSGEVHLMFETMSSMLPHVRAGRIRGLGVTSLKRSSAAPELPTIAESGLPGYEVIAWGGVVTRAGAPKHIVNKLNSAFNSALTVPALIEKMAALGLEPAGGTSEQFDALAKKETAKWGEVIKRSGLTLD
jgi:tripartite-type tricarboxylate transporter receptor subunit TctC